MSEWKYIFELFFIHRLHFLIQHILHQSTNIYNDDGNDTRVGRKGCSDRDDSINYEIIDASM